MDHSSTRIRLMQPNLLLHEPLQCCAEYAQDEVSDYRQTAKTIFYYPFCKVTIKS